MEEDPPRRPSQRANKPLTEKRRRLRINASLEQIKYLIMEALGQDPASTPAKLEKADILELTVRYLQNQRLNSQPNLDMLTHYREGYRACMRDITSFLGPNTDAKLKDSMLHHLNQRLVQVSAPSPVPVQQAAVKVELDYTDGARPLQDLNQNIVNNLMKEPNQEEPHRQSVQYIEESQRQSVQYIEDSQRQSAQYSEDSQRQSVQYSEEYEGLMGLPGIQSFQQQGFQSMMEGDAYQTYAVLQPVKQEVETDLYNNLYNQEHPE